MRILESLNSDVRINLSRREALVTEQLLDNAKIGTRVEQMSGK